MSCWDGAPPLGTAPLAATASVPVMQYHAASREAFSLRARSSLRMLHRRRSRGWGYVRVKSAWKHRRSAQLWVRTTRGAALTGARSDSLAGRHDGNHELASYPRGRHGFPIVKHPEARGRLGRVSDHAAAPPVYCAQLELRPAVRCDRSQATAAHGGESGERFASPLHPGSREHAPR